MVGTRRAPSSSSKKKKSSAGESNGHHANGTTNGSTKKSSRRSTSTSSSSKKKSVRSSPEQSEVEHDTPRSKQRVSARKSRTPSVEVDAERVSPSPSPVENTPRAQRKKDAGDDRVVREFGGAPGVTAIALCFPVIMLYFWSCLEFHNGQIYGPSELTSLEAWKKFLETFAGHIVEKGLPTVYAVKIYIGYIVWSALLASFMPGPTVKGMPVPSLNYAQLNYLCNGYSSFYLTLAVSLFLNHHEIFRLRDIVDNFGHLLTTAIITGWLTSIITYVASLAVGSSHRLSGDHIYDWFMGAPLNPRVGPLDLKMWSEIRVPWIILFYVSLSAVVKQWEILGGNIDALFLVPAGLWFTLLGHWLYVNACMKGEDCIPATWDIFYEKWGFMLIFWNLAGVPFTYCYNTLYLLKRAEAGDPLVLPWWINALLVVVLLSAYYIWDVAQAQKSHFRQAQAGTLLYRWTFPQFPAGHLENPKFIKTKHGSPLLTDGWWGVARKIHYTADFTMSMCWALICGFTSPIPYFYPFFFCCVLVHRVTRDMERCATKYGDDWVRYCKKVPYIFIPGVF